MFSLILHTATRLLMPLMLLFSVFLLLRGHNAPGGGFVGGLVAATALVLYAIAAGVAEARRALSIDTLRFIPIGLALAVGSAILPMFFGKPFMTSLWWPMPLPVIGALGTPVVFDIGVYMLVLGIALTIIFSLMESTGDEPVTPERTSPEARRRQ